MKVLLITNYWYPWNTSGSFRWLHLSQYLNFDVLTSKKPKKGFYDETMPMGKCQRLVRIGRNLPACLSGVVLAIASWFIRADRYVYTCPPETLLIGAWINQLLGRDVYVDMRDKIDRHTQPHKWLVSIYWWLYKRIENVCVAMQFFDPTKPVIRHGYDISIRPMLPKKEDMLRSNNLIYAAYCQFLYDGYGRDYSDQKFRNYNSSSLVTIRHLSNPIIGKENLHKECFEFEPESWKQIAEKMKQFLHISR